MSRSGPVFPHDADRIHVGRYSIGRWSPLKWALALLVLVSLDGVVGLVVGIIIGIELLVVGSPRRLLALSLPCFGAVLLQNLWRGLPSESDVSALWVLSNKTGNHLAFAGFAFLAAGLILPERRRRISAVETPSVQPTLIEPPPADPAP